MPTYRDLFEKLGTLTQEQLDSDIRIITAGYPDAQAAGLLSNDLIPEVLELARTERDCYHYTPSEEGFEEAGVVDFSDNEIKEMGIDEDEDYQLICKKGTVVFRLKNNIYIGPDPEVHVGNLDTSILHL